jgi:hypothetical protein
MIILRATGVANSGLLHERGDTTDAQETTH